MQLSDWPPAPQLSQTSRVKEKEIFFKPFLGQRDSQFTSHFTPPVWVDDHLCSQDALWLRLQQVQEIIHRWMETVFFLYPSGTVKSGGPWPCEVKATNSILPASWQLCPLRWTQLLMEAVKWDVCLFSPSLSLWCFAGITLSYMNEHPPSNLIHSHQQELYVAL